MSPLMSTHLLLGLLGCHNCTTKRKFCLHMGTLGPYVLVSSGGIHEY